MDTTSPIDEFATPSTRQEFKTIPTTSIMWGLSWKRVLCVAMTLLLVIWVSVLIWLAKYGGFEPYPTGSSGLGVRTVDPIYGVRGSTPLDKKSPLNSIDPAIVVSRHDKSGNEDSNAGTVVVTVHLASNWAETKPVIKNIQAIVSNYWPMPEFVAWSPPQAKPMELDSAFLLQPLREQGEPQPIDAHRVSVHRGPGVASSSETLQKLLPVSFAETAEGTLRLHFSAKTAGVYEVQVVITAANEARAGTEEQIEVFRHPIRFAFYDPMASEDYSEQQLGQARSRIAELYSDPQWDVTRFRLENTAKSFERPPYP